MKSLLAFRLAKTKATKSWVNSYGFCLLDYPCAAVRLSEELIVFTSQENDMELEESGSLPSNTVEDATEAF